MRSLAPVYRTLAAMHRAGIPWPRAVQSATLDDARFVTVRRDLETGRTLSEALGGIVDPLDRALIEAGEKDGSLDTTLDRLAERHEDARRRGRELRARQAYPVYLAHVAAVLMALPDVIQSHTLAAVGWAALVLVPVWTWLLLQRRFLGAERRPATSGDPPAPPPLVGPLRSRVEEADARALEALGRLYEAGVPLAEATPLALRAGWGGRAALDLATLRDRVRRGDDVAGAFRHLPPDLAGRIAAAEESGSLGEALVQIAGELAFDAEVRRKKLHQLLPLVLMLLVGGIIAARLFTFYAQYYSQLSGL